MHSKDFTKRKCTVVNSVRVKGEKTLFVCPHRTEIVQNTQRRGNASNLCGVDSTLSSTTGKYSIFGHRSIVVLCIQRAQHYLMEKPQSNTHAKKHTTKWREIVRRWCFSMQNGNFQFSCRDCSLVCVSGCVPISIKRCEAVYFVPSSLSLLTRAKSCIMMHRYI